MPLARESKKAPSIGLDDYGCQKDVKVFLHAQNLVVDDQNLKVYMTTTRPVW